MRAWATRRFVNLPLILCLAVLILAPAMAFAANPVYGWAKRMGVKS